MKVISRQWSVVSVLIATLLGLGSAEAQQPKVRRIGFLSGGFPGVSHWTTSLTKELRSIGYVEGKNIIIEARYSENDLDRLSKFAHELAGRQVDVIVTGGRNDARAARKATKTIPIVGLSLSDDPVGDGLVDSLARPGGNVTGITTYADALIGKRLELLKEIVPGLSRVAVLWNPLYPEAAGQWEESQNIARVLGLEPYSMQVRSTDQLEPAFKQAIKAQAGALFITTGVFNNTHEKRIADLAIKHRLAAIYSRESFVASGGLLAYGTDEMERYRRVAVFVDKILKGTKPADLPVEQPTKFELVLNLKAAKLTAITIPTSVLGRADRVIK